VKKALLYITAITLSLAVLAVSGGFTFSRMVCFKSGFSAYGLSLGDACCQEKFNGTTSISEKCCDIQDQEIAVGNFLGGFYKTEFQNVYAIPAFSIFLAQPFAYKPAYSVSAKGDAPPERAPDILLLIHKLSV
jgi:hypothetical protein